MIVLLESIRGQVQPVEVLVEAVRVFFVKAVRVLLAKRGHSRPCAFKGRDSAYRGLSRPCEWAKSVCFAATHKNLHLIHFSYAQYLSLPCPDPYTPFGSALS